MNQTEYDLTEFVLINKSEILSHLQKELEPFSHAERLFQNSPLILRDFYTTHKLRILREYLYNNYSIDSEELLLIIDAKFLTLILS